METCRRVGAAHLRCDGALLTTDFPSSPGATGSVDLVGQAAHELGTKRTTDTVHQALREVIARARRAQLAQRDFEDLTPDTLEAMRRPTRRTA